MLRRAVRYAFTTLSALSLLLCVAVCVLWVRGRSGTDRAAWEYDRYRADRGAASTQVHATSDKRRLGVNVIWGQVGPYDGSVVYGYALRADQRGGRPRVTFATDADVGAGWWGDVDPMRDAGGWGPVRWQSSTRGAPPPPGESSRSVHLGVSHWLAAAVLLVMPGAWLLSVRRDQVARRKGHCPACGYDLRASPEHCPECGTPVHRVV
ncbi:MAG TPA: hypothetical protein VER17_04950 [Tepidisphaeraceae bacterium]|nr:hypothetical protein [Tepidisphaeraceae bacterium]